MTAFLKPPRIFVAFLCFLAGYLVHSYYTRQAGFIWIDDGLVTDAAWKIANGMIPFKDFYTIQGLSAAFTEAPFLLIFGNNVNATTIHVSVINGLASAVVFWILSIAGLGRFISFCFAFMTAWIFYAPQGQAFSVQHGVFYYFLAVALGLWAVECASSARTRRLAWFAAGVLMVVSFFGKQNLGFMYPAFLVIAFSPPFRHILERAIFGVVGAASVILSLALATGRPLHALDRMWEYTIAMPAHVASAQGRLKGGLNDALKVYELATTASILVTFAVFFAALYLYLRRPKNHYDTPQNAGYGSGLRLAALGGLMQLGGIYIPSTALWISANLLQPAFLAAGIAVAGLARILSASLRSVDGAKEMPHLRAIVLAPVVIVLFINAYDTWWMGSNMVVRRGFYGFNSQAKGDAISLPSDVVAPAMDGLEYRELRRWTSPGLLPDLTKADFVEDRKRDKEVLEIIETVPGNILLIGFPKYFYVFSGKPSPLPIVSLQPNFSSPYRGTPDYEDFLKALERNFNRFDVSTVVIEDDFYMKKKDIITNNSALFCEQQERAGVHLVKICNRDPGFGRTLAHLIGADGAAASKLPPRK
ncbi:MAG: hypothetical protein KAH11_09845 [Rhodospirillales bacterium]|nr:hypothetical protein [Rhodospirillales bacterium]